MDGVAQIQMRNHRSRVRGVVVHVMAVAHLARPDMAAPVMRRQLDTPSEEVEHLGVPVIGPQWPAMIRRPSSVTVLIRASLLWRTSADVRQFALALAA